MLEVNGLCGLHTLGPISLSLVAGESLAVLGPSGIGKTLLLRAIADLDPNQGEVLFEGRRREAMAAPDWRRQVMYFPAQSGWWATGTASHFSDPSFARRLLPRLGLPAEALGWPVARLSTGEKQRLALIRGLTLAPRILLLDEPTSGLDGEATARVETLLQAHTDKGGSMIFVSHDPAQARRLARRGLVLSSSGAEERLL